MSESFKQIGNILKKDGPQIRDAIHVAIVSVVATENINAGSPVALVPGTKTNEVKMDLENPIGVIDPFIQYHVKKGDRCLVFLKPGTVINLRHEWNHPELDKDRLGEHIEYLQNYARNTHVKYETLISAVSAFVDGGCEGAVLETWESYEVPDEFWLHFELVTGKKGHGYFWGCCI